MPSTQGLSVPPTRRLSIVPPVVACLILIASPHLARLGSPSLYADDVDRVAQVRAEPLGRMLFAPFNEHVAPLFQLVTWFTWRVAGERLARAPMAFTLASFLPFVLTLALLWRVLRRETRGDAGALAGMAIFSISWLSIETVWWYSASSFMWSLCFTLAAWEATEPGALSPRSRFPAAFLATAAAPAFSMIGILAGPVAVVKAAATGGKSAWKDALAALLGTCLFLAVYGMVHDRDVVASNVERNAGVWSGLVAATRAPAAALVPAVFGRKTLPTAGASGPVFTLLSAAAALGLIVRAWKNPDERPALLSGLALIAGGYALTFCARAGAPGLLLLQTQRYHLFPMLGLLLVLSPALRWVFEPRRDPVPRLWLAVALASALVATHRSELRGRARFLRFPDQAATLDALDRLDLACAHSGVSRAQAIAALEPDSPAWAPAGRSVFVMLGPCAERARVPASSAPAILGTLYPRPPLSPQASKKVARDWR